MVVSGGVVRLYRILGACAFKVHSYLQFSMKKSTNPLIGACAYMRGIRVIIRLRLAAASEDVPWAGEVVCHCTGGWLDPSYRAHI